MPALRLPHAEGLDLPAYATVGAAGLDLRAAVVEPVVLAPGARTLVPTGLILHIPEGHEGQIRARSGLAYKHGVTVLNGPGTIDADYRGEVKVLLVNLGAEPFTVARGDRIAQLVLARFARAALVELDLAETEAQKTARGAGGFGSTGLG
ncbi:MAG: dUTP diphosphatase [Deltaproteobacteria bacterium]|nr:dUTP diphosphatase [Deltaproteobacteria bacterium]